MLQDILRRNQVRRVHSLEKIQGGWEQRTRDDAEAPEEEGRRRRRQQCISFQFKERMEREVTYFTFSLSKRGLTM